jgi:hypothetical protein
MTGTTVVAQLRTELAKNRERKKFGTYPAEVRERAVAYARERVKAGVGVGQIASELGVSGVTVRSWVGGPAAHEASRPQGKQDGSVSLLPVVVRSDQGVRRPTRLEVEFPDGTRLGVNGITGQDLVDAIQALRRPQ